MNDADSLQAMFVCDIGFETQSRSIMARASVDVDVRTIVSGKFRRYAHFSVWGYVRHPSIMLHNFFDLFKIFAGYIQSLLLLAKFRPDVVFAKGGFVCLPLGLAAATLRIPLVIHDSDVRPGLTNRVLARFATAIATGFPLENYQYSQEISHYTGVPVDAAYRPVTLEDQADYKKKLGFLPNLPLVMAFGGGLGAVVINDAAAELARQLGESVQVYNGTGKANINRAQEKGAGLRNYRAEGFVPGLHDIMAAADLIVTRASATALQELAGMAKPVIAVPAKHLGDQRQNAKVYASADAVAVLGDDELDEKLSPLVVRLIADDARRMRLAKALHAFARPEAATKIAEILRKITAQQ